MSKNIDYNTPVLRVENLKQYFKSGHGKRKIIVKAVDDISFTIYKREVFGLVGESGCGKTTTGRSIIKLYNITGGNVYFKGKRISAGTQDYIDHIKTLKLQSKNGEITQEEAVTKITEQRELLKQAKIDNRANTELMNKMQMIFQDPIGSLNPRMIVREIIAEGLRIQGVKDPKVIDEKVYQVLKLVGLLPEHASRYPHEFSGGQRQRIGVARSLVVNPELIIADEPISALDVSIQAQVINLLNDLKEQLGLTILFIAHDLSVVKYFSDRIGVMYYGKMVEMATSEELFKNPLHPYTKALLSAIPLPDPDIEKSRKRMIYNPRMHDYSVDKPSFKEITPGHFVLANDKEFEQYKTEIKE